ncbi:MAG: polysaccharide biosynthesis/export family protein [Candidatus Omnitrophota bacterium]
MRKITVIILCFSLLFNSGCATMSQGTRVKPTSDYRFRVGDELRVVIWKELDEKTIVRPDYKISLPLIGEIDCKRKTPEILSDELSEKYKAKVVVIVAKYHNWKDDFKGFVEIIRDSAFFYFIGKKITEE